MREAKDQTQLRDDKDSKTDNEEVSLPLELPNVDWESRQRVCCMLAFHWNRYVLRYLVSHAGRPQVISTHWVNVPPTLESTQNWVSTNKIFCARGVRGEECLEGNNMLIWVDTRIFISPTRWRYQRWLQKSQLGGTRPYMHGWLPQASCIWCSCHRDTCVSYIDCK